MRRHQLPYKNYKEILNWLIINVQESYTQNFEKYNSSSIGQFVEWRSKDLNTWIFRIAGNPPKIYVEINDEQKEILFLLRWK